MSLTAAAPAVQKGRIPLPPRIVVCKWGNNRDLDGEPVIVNETTLAELAANQSRYGFDEVALDFGHNTAPKTDAEGNPVPTLEPQPIAGMGRLSVEKGVGIVYTPVSWTPDGETYYTGRHYRDLSPTVGKNEKGEVTFVHSVALTRSGQIHDLHAYGSQQAAAPLPKLSALQTTTPMETDLDFRSLLCKKLGLDPATATDEAIAAAAAADGADALSAEGSQEGGDGKEGKPAAPATKPMAAGKAPDLSALSARLDRMEKAEESRERDAIVREATAAGKVIPLSADAIKLTPLSVLREMVGTLKAGEVPLQAATTTAAGKEAPVTKKLSADEAAIADQMGLTDAQKARMAAMS